MSVTCTYWSEVCSAADKAKLFSEGLPRACVTCNFEQYLNDEANKKIEEEIGQLMQQLETLVERASEQNRLGQNTLETWGEHMKVEEKVHQLMQKSNELVDAKPALLCLIQCRKVLETMQH
jgi:DNA phosphorothioation-dependent restriction protein DptG